MKKCAFMLLLPVLLFCLLAGTAITAEGKERSDASTLDPQKPEAEQNIRIRDPFLPGESVRGKLYTPSVDVTQLRVQAILYHPGNPKALISGQIVGIGDKLFEYSVAEIRRDRVRIKSGTRIYQLFLKLPFESK